MDLAALEVYRSRALQMANAMKLCNDGLESYASAVALLAVHSAISYSDALHIQLTGARLKSENHRNAIESARRACKKARINPTGIKHLEKLLNAKTDISYEDRTVDSQYALTLSIAAERFQTWVEQNLGKKGMPQ